jgi:NADH-quinone oxidoreductase subunit E
MLDEKTETEVRALRRAHDGDGQAAAVSALRAVQARYGWVSDERLFATAALLDLRAAELDALATFYALIHRRPVGRTVIHVCDGISCFLKGAAQVRDALRVRLGVNVGEVTADGAHTLLDICCVGACDRAPAALVGRRTVAPVDPRRLDPLLEEGAE